ncbi:hypothetical protein DVA81_19875, partial [Acinetobacter baumannii]
HVCVRLTLTRQWPASLSSDLKEESWSGDRGMEGLWTGNKNNSGVQLADRDCQSNQQKANEWLR